MPRRAGKRRRAESLRGPSGALERAHGVVGEVELEPAARQQAQRAVALALVGRRRGEPAAQDVDRARELVLPGVLPELGVDDLRRDPQLQRDGARCARCPSRPAAGDPP